MKLTYVIKNFMAEKGHDIDSLSLKSGISQLQVNQILDGVVKPSGALLMKLSRALEVPIELFVDGNEAVSAAIITKDERPEIVRDEVTATPGIHFSSLAPVKTMRSMEPVMVSMKREVCSESATCSHEGEKFAYIVRGEVELTLGDQVNKLSTGDSIYYDAIVPHSYKTISEISEILIVTYTPW